MTETARQAQNRAIAPVLRDIAATARAVTTFGVVTRVDPPPGQGNLAMGEAYLDPQAKGGGWDDPALPLHEALDAPALALYVRVPVFKVGELLLMANGRDQFTRKPDKWDVDVEYFGDIDAAIECVHAVMSAHDTRTEVGP